jgi:HK97 family phage portal protein
VISLGIADIRPPRRETRAKEVSWDALRGAIDTGGALVSPRIAENLSTVLACVGAISSAMASLPAFVYRLEGEGRIIDEGHPVARLIAAGPNQHQSWPDFVEWLLASVLLRGNALAEIVTDGRGAVTGLRPIPWEHCSVQMLPSGRLAYDITEITALYGGTGRPRRLLQDEVLHLRDRSDDGIIGRSRLQRAAAVVRAGMSIQEFAGKLYENGVFPSGAFELEGAPDMAARQRFIEHLREEFAGPANAAKFLFLTHGMKWKQISISPEDAEFLGSRRFTTEELCRLFNTPPVIVGDLSNSSFNNTETLTRFFAQSTLAPWIRKLEAEFQRSVFGSARNRLELDLSGLLRGDPAQRWAAWKIAVEAQILTPDEVRAEEGFNPKPQTSPASAGAQ